MTDTDRLTDEELNAMRQGYALARQMDSHVLRVDTRDAIRLLDEVDRLRAELDQTQEARAAEAELSASQDEAARLRAENTAQAARLDAVLDAHPIFELFGRQMCRSCTDGNGESEEVPCDTRRAALGLDQDGEGNG